MEEGLTCNVEISYDRFGFRTIVAREGDTILRKFFLAPGKIMKNETDLDLKKYKTIIYTVNRPGMRPEVQTVVRA